MSFEESWLLATVGRKGNGGEKSGVSRERERWWEVQNIGWFWYNIMMIVEKWNIFKLQVNCLIFKIHCFDMKSSPIITRNFNKFSSYLRKQCLKIFYSICNPLPPLHVSHIGRIDDFWWNLVRIEFDHLKIPPNMISNIKILELHLWLIMINELQIWLL